MRKPLPQSDTRGHPPGRKTCIGAPDLKAHPPKDRAQARKPRLGKSRGDDAALTPEPRQEQGREQDQEHKQGKRFVEPYPFTEAQRAGIAAALAKIGLGDEMSRDIFIGAIAYDLAVLESTLRAETDAPGPHAAQVTSKPEPKPEPEAEPSTASAPATDLAQAADALAKALAALSVEQRDALCRALAAQDSYRRDYGVGYLRALGLELGRVADAAALAPAAAGGAKSSKGAAAAESGRDARAGQPDADLAKGAEQGEPSRALPFIRHAASVYEQCFDARPGVGMDQPFVHALEAVAEHTGVAIPLAPARLQAALSAR
jgi:hypothetical protein